MDFSRDNRPQKCQLKSFGGWKLKLINTLTLQTRRGTLPLSVLSTVAPFTGAQIESFELVLKTPPENEHDNKTSTIWRCISYWTWGCFNVMLVFRGVACSSWYLQASKQPTSNCRLCRGRQLFGHSGQSGAESPGWGTGFYVKCKWSQQGAILSLGYLNPSTKIGSDLELLQGFYSHHLWCFFHIWRFTCFLPLVEKYGIELCVCVNIFHAVICCIPRLFWWYFRMVSLFLWEMIQFFGSPQGRGAIVLPLLQRTNQCLLAGLCWLPILASRYEGVYELWLPRIELPIEVFDQYG